MRKRPSQPQSHQTKFVPLKFLGQHFLQNKAVLAQIIKAAQLQPTDTVIEVGPGEGVLTKELAKRAGKVIAIEKDARLIPILKENFKGIINIEVVLGDILKLTPAKARFRDLNRSGGYKVVANLPYYAATRIIRQFLEANPQPRLMVLMVQKEVGQRICAKPPAMTLLSVAIQFYAQPKIIGYVSKESFWPKPKVDGAIIRLSIKDGGMKTDEKCLFRIVRAGFSQPRKQILNNLAKRLGLDKEEVRVWLSKSGIKPEQRPSTLSPEDWLTLELSFSLCFPKVCARIN